MKELDNELENYFENTIIPQLFVDADLVLRRFTPPAMKQFTLTPADVGKNIADVRENIRYPTFLDNIKEVIATGKLLEKEIQTLDRKWFQMNILPYIIRSENRTNGVIITFIDITSRIHTLRELQKLNTDRQTFMFSVSHDIKQPLAILNIMPDAFDFAFKENNAELFHENIDRLKRAVNNIKGIVNELTELINSSPDEATTNERVNIENIYEDATLALKEEIIREEAIIHTDFQVSEIFFSRKNLRSIVYNLVLNALKYRDTGRRPEITIATKRAGNYIELSIKDNGIGMQPEHLSLIFNRYSRVDTNVSGTGLGLYLVRTMLENNGDRITVESTFGEGSLFTVYFQR